MNILGINLDKGIFKEKSASLERLKNYSQLVDKLFIIVWTTEKFKSIIVDDKLFIYPTNSCCRAGYYFSTIRLARRIMKRTKIDVVFTQDPFETGLAGWIVSRVKKIPLQIQIHTDVFSPYFWQESFINKIRVLLAKFLIPSAKFLRVVSERIKKSITASIKYPAEKIFVLPIFVDVKKIQEAIVAVDLHQKYPQFNFIILMASRLTREKNISLAIKAMHDLVKKYPKAGLIIAGSGSEERRLRLQVIDYRLQANVIFESWTNEVFSYYKTADLFLLTSNYEGYGMSVMEAKVAGCPVVMTEVGCAGEWVKNEEDGLVVPVQEKGALVHALERIIEDRESRLKIIRNGKETVKKLNSQLQYLESYKKSWQLSL